MKIRVLYSILLVILLVVPSVANSDARFDGDWRGIVRGSERGVEFQFRLVIREGEAETETETDQFVCRDSVWEPLERSEKLFFRNKNNAIYLWIEEGGKWTETQTYSLSYVKRDTLHLVWARHVNNNYEDYSETWHTSGDGNLHNVHDGSEECLSHIG